MSFMVSVNDHFCITDFYQQPFKILMMELFGGLNKINIWRTQCAELQFFILKPFVTDYKNILNFCGFTCAASKVSSCVFI